MGTQSSCKSAAVSQPLSAIRCSCCIPKHGGETLPRRTDGWMGGWRMEKMEDEMSDASQSTVLSFFCSSSGPPMLLLFHSLTHSLTHSFTQPERGFVRSPPFPLTRMLCYFSAKSSSEAIYLSISSSLSLCLKANTHTHAHTLSLTHQYKLL